MNILFLYTELAGYFLACVNKLAEDPEYKVHIVRWPVNNEAPFRFILDQRLSVYDRSDYDASSLEMLVEKIHPDFIYCSGWIDRDYLKVAGKYTKRIPVVVGFDNHWKGSLKQHIASLISPFTLKRIFNHCWVPGEPQVDYALKMGFHSSQIIQGFYSADVDHFSAIYDHNKELKARRYPHRLVYSGRYVPYKWVKELCEVFIELKTEHQSDWELWCLGTGPEEKIRHESIRHLGFVQPEQQADILRDTGIFILPSTSEPWGVVVHEYAAAGFPLICSSAVGAASAFVKEGQNGFIFKAGDREHLKQTLLNAMNLEDDKLLRMGDRSHELAQSVTPESWAIKVKQLTQSFHHVRN